MSNSKPFKQRDIENCAVCSRGLMHQENALGMFWRIKLERLLINLEAVRMQDGLERAMGRAAPLAQIMGPDHDLAKSIADPVDILVCEHCMLHRSMASLFNAVGRKIEARDKAEAETAVIRSDELIEGEKPLTLGVDLGDHY